jgi:drug/metabolite transporter (DMT)-like permease
MNRKGLGLAYLFAVLNAVIIGFSFLFVKMSLDYAHPLDTLAYRFVASFAVMSIPVACGWVKLKYRGKPIFKLMLLSVTFPLGFFTLQAFGLQYATSAEGGILYAFTPVVTLVLASVFLKETNTTLQKLSILMSVFGVLFIFIMKGSSIDLSNISGLFLLFLTCIAFAVYSIMARSLSKQFSPAEITYFMLGIGFIVFLIVSFTSHLSAGTMEEFLEPLTNSTFIISILYLGVVSSLVTALMSNYILSKMEASKMSVFTNLSTVTSIVAGAMFLGEGVAWYHLVGSGLIILGVIGTQLLGQKSRQTNK